MRTCHIYFFFFFSERLGNLPTVQWCAGKLLHGRLSTDLYHLPIWGGVNNLNLAYFRLPVWSHCTWCWEDTHIINYCEPVGGGSGTWLSRPETQYEIWEPELEFLVIYKDHPLSHCIIIPSDIINDSPDKSQKPWNL